MLSKRGTATCQRWRHFRKDVAAFISTSSSYAPDISPSFFGVPIKDRLEDREQNGANNQVCHSCKTTTNENAIMSHISFSYIIQASHTYQLPNFPSQPQWLVSRKAEEQGNEIVNMLFPNFQDISPGKYTPFAVPTISFANITLLQYSHMTKANE
jgi:hypothetical protein